mmetsp:Transcript_7584/g.15265  ORF Transcript_7584/g.15265 Transcript_7584/m.15265 type:complete len:80 (+) Transcript_7584:552-791(+)
MPLFVPSRFRPLQISTKRPTCSANRDDRASPSGAEQRYYHRYRHLSTSHNIAWSPSGEAVDWPLQVDMPGMVTQRRDKG